MHMLRLLAPALALSMLCAQELTKTGLPVAGARAGTMRYIVMFEQRSFDLEGFRAAVLARRSPAAVDAIVADLERRVQLDQAAFAAAVTRAGGDVVTQWWLVNACAIDVPPAAVDVLLQHENVLSIEPNRTTEPVILTATNASNHNSDAVNASGITGRGTTVAIMDTGLDADSAGSGRPHATFFINGDINNRTGPGIGGSRLLANEQVGSFPPDNTHPHGTGVASITAGFKWSSSAAHDNGHAPDALIVGYSIGNNSGGGSDEATMASAWQRIAAQKVRFNTVAANNSYSGISCRLNDLIQQALDAAAYNADIMISVAAANSGASTTFSQPTANGLAVAATSATSKAVASFSSRGPLSCDTARFWPDIAACGVNTVMAMVDSATGQYVGSGTSMAAPQVCGAAALVRGANPSLNAQETKAILLATTEDISAQNPNPPYNSRYAYGMGFLRDDLAVQLAQRQSSAFTRTMSVTNVAQTFAVNMTANQPQRVVLSWPRRLGTTLSNQWSNLRLRILDGANVLAQSDDPNQLYESVKFTAPASGLVNIEVLATSLEGGQPIDFSVAHTGTLVAYVPGAFTAFGNACPGSNGTPVIGAHGVPTLGAHFRITLDDAKVSSPAVLAFGASNTTWGSINLPAGIPGTSCFVNVSLDLPLPLATDAAGEAMVMVHIPAEISLLGAGLHTQWWIGDNANSFGWVSTRGATLRIGGAP